MQTPGAPACRALPTLYGDGEDSINRRAVIGGLAALAWAAPAFARGAKSITTLAWTGTAHLEVDGRSLDIATDTRLDVPLLRVRSTTYILEQGPATARTLILEPDGVWMDRAGKRTALPPQLGVHERQQYAIYAWLLRIQQGKRPRPGKLPLHAPPWPDIVFEIGPDGYPTAAELTVDAAEPGEPRIAERIVFSGRIDSNGVRWPREFDLTQGGKPYFKLSVATFTAT